MTTRYRVEYALKSHRRDELIEWIKGLLAVPFVLHAQPHTVFDENAPPSSTQMTSVGHRRYAEIMKDVEDLIIDHIEHSKNGVVRRSKLRLLVPSVGTFFTPLQLKEAFAYEDKRRCISSRRFVPPSFNDIRVVLNTAQMMSHARRGALDLVTFDGDVTLYDDGSSLASDNPVITRILNLMHAGTKMAIVTAAGYDDPAKYYERLSGLLHAIHESNLPVELQKNFIVMGGESNYLLQFDPSAECLLRLIHRDEWILPEMRQWQDSDISALLSVAEEALQTCVKNMQMKAQVLRKERAVGIIPTTNARFTREQLEETVLVTQNILEASPLSLRIPFCAFNGGNDVFVDIGDKSIGVQACQRYFGGIPGGRTLHVGDQFLSANGANDFKARLASTTAWIAAPDETVRLLDDYIEFRDQAASVSNGALQG